MWAVGVYRGIPPSGGWVPPIRTAVAALAVALASCSGPAAAPTTTTTTTSPPPPTTVEPTTTTPAATTTTTTAPSYPYDFAVHPASPAITTGDWDSGYTAVPFITRTDEEFLLFYSGAPGRGPELGLATSPDGIEFTKHPDNPLLEGTGLGVGWLMAVERETDWVLWYVEGFSPPYRDLLQARAPSPAGPWSDDGEIMKAPDREWDVFFVPTGVTDIDGTLWMAYAAYDQTDRIPSVALMTSTDGGETWVPRDEPIHTATPGGWDEKGVVPANIVETPRGLELFYLGFSSPPKVGYQADTIPMGVLVSADGGETWVPDNDGLPILDTGEKGWPGVTVAWIDGEYHLYLGDDLGSEGIKHMVGTIP